MTNNKIALITGANKGIGYEVARQLGELGITVLVAARNQATADETANQLQGRHRSRGCTAECDGFGAYCEGNQMDK